METPRAREQNASSRRPANDDSPATPSVIVGQRDLRTPHAAAQSFEDSPASGARTLKSHAPDKAGLLAAETVDCSSPYGYAIGDREEATHLPLALKYDETARQARGREIARPPMRFGNHALENLLGGAQVRRVTTQKLILELE